MRCKKVRISLNPGNINSLLFTFMRILFLHPFCSHHFSNWVGGYIYPAWKMPPNCARFLRWLRLNFVPASPKCPGGKDEKTVARCAAQLSYCWRGIGLPGEVGMGGAEFLRRDCGVASRLSLQSG